MTEFVRILVPIAIALVAIVLGLGLWSMTRRGKSGLSQTLMRWRVVAQIVAMVIIIAAIYLQAG